MNGLWSMEETSACLCVGKGGFLITAAVAMLTAKSSQVSAGCKVLHRSHPEAHSSPAGEQCYVHCTFEATGC